MTIDIYPASAGDLPALAGLHAAAFPDEPWDAESLGRFAALPGALTLIAGRPAEAFLLCLAPGPEAEVVTLAVSPAARRGGRATALLKSAARQLAACGCGVLHLEVAADNTAACALYCKLGFRQSGLRRGYYRRKDQAALPGQGSQGVDALLLSLALA